MPTVGVTRPPGAHHGSTHGTERSIGRTRPLLLVASAVALVVAPISGATPRADAATITAAYEVGYRNVTVNGYGATGLGAFTLRMDPGDPGGGSHLALCIEAHTSHSTTQGAYRLVPNQLDSPQLDYLLWRYGATGTAMSQPLGADHDTATALGALAWFYAGADRRGGGAVWSNPTTGAAVTPAHPHPWSDLPADASIGLRSGGQRLIGAERRVYELFVEAESRRGPWELSEIRHHDARAAVTVSGPAGTLADIDGIRFVVRDHRDRVVVNEVTRTNNDGIAQVEVPTLADGGSIEVSMFAPGVHQEWDGDGSIQRLATATSLRLERSAPVDPRTRHIEVHKVSSDDAFATDGAHFELRDAEDRRVGTATTGADGRARFDGIDPTRHPEPYRIVEIRAPDGLAPIAGPVPVPVGVSTDPARPTVIQIRNDPHPHHLIVRKRFDDDRVGPSDRSGFEFEVTRSDGTAFGTTTTGTDGVTAPLAVTAGRFRVCERSRPPWARGTIDPGCSTVDIAGPAGSTHEVTYTNLVPTPSISTRVRADETDESGESDEPRESDGREFTVIGADGGRLVDVVTYRGLVPGGTYTLRGEILVHTEDGPATTSVTGTTTFVAEQAEGIIEVTFDVEPTVSTHDGRTHLIERATVVQRLLIGDGGDGAEPIVDHSDPNDLAQTFWIPRIETDAAIVTPPGTTETTLDGGVALVDVARLSGLPPGHYRSVVTWFEREDGACTAIDITAEAWFEPDEQSRAVVEVGPRDVDRAREGLDHGGDITLVAFHRVERVVDDTREFVVGHEDCDAAEQTVTIPAPEPPGPVDTPTTIDPPTPTTTTVVAEPEPPIEPEAVAPPPGAPTTVTSPPLPATGRQLGFPGGLALMLFGAGGLVVISAVRERRPLT